MYFDRYKTCYFFDSYGNMPEYFGLLEYIDRFSSNMEYNKDQIKGFFSNIINVTAKNCSKTRKSVEFWMYPDR